MGWFFKISTETRALVLTAVLGAVLFMMGFILLVKASGIGLNLGTGVYLLLLVLVVWHNWNTVLQVLDEVRQADDPGTYAP